MDGDGGFKHRGARDVFPADVPQRRRSCLRWDAHSAHKAAGLRWCFLGAKGDPVGVCVRGGSKRMKMNRTWTSSTLVLSSFVWSCSYWYWNCGSFRILLSCTRICTMFPLFNIQVWFLKKKGTLVCPKSNKSRFDQLHRQEF